MAKKTMSKTKMTAKPADAPQKTNGPKVRTPSLFRAGIVAFVVIAVINFVVNGLLLAPVWSAMEVAGVVRENQGGPMALGGIFVIVLVMAFIFAWFLGKARVATAGQAFGFGVAAGVLVALPDLATFLFFRVPPIVPIVGLVTNIVSFALAGLAAWFVNN